MRTKTPYFLPTSFTQTTALVERLIAENVQGFLKPSEPNRSLEAVDSLNSTQGPLRPVSEPTDPLAALWTYQEPTERLRGLKSVIWRRAPMADAEYGKFGSDDLCLIGSRYAQTLS